MSYYIEPIGPDMVRVHEEELSYPVSRAQAEADLATVRANRAKYGDDNRYLRRVTFFEDILAAFPGGA